MKKLILMMALSIGLTVFAHAQAPKKASGKIPKALAQKLNLTPDQTEKVTAIMQTKAAQLDSLNADSTVAKKATRSKRSAINTTADTKINNVLNADQQKIYADFKVAQQEKRKNKAAAAGTATPPVTPPGL